MGSKTGLIFEDFVKQYQLYKRWDDKEYLRVRQDLAMLDRLKYYQPTYDGKTLKVNIPIDSSFAPIIKAWVERK